MKKRCFILPLLSSYILGASSCNKDSAKSNTASSEYFPNTIGNYWEYQLQDSTSGYPTSASYTVKVTISGIQKLVDGNDAFIWKYEYPSHTDTNFIRIVGDTVKVFDLFYSSSLRYLEFPRKIFILPLYDGQQWDGKLLVIDNFHVYNAPVVKTGAGSFTDCLNIYHYYLAPNTEYTDSYIFKPNVGFVQISNDHYVMSPRTFQTWNLTRYYLH